MSAAVISRDIGQGSDPGQRGFEQRPGWRGPAGEDAGRGRAGGGGLSAAAVERDREAVEYDLVLRRRQLGLQPPDERCGAGCGCEQPQHDLLRRRELDELLLERLREAAMPQVPAVELLEEPDRPPLAQLAHRLADEDDQLRGDLLARRPERLALRDLAQRPGIPLRAA